VKRIVFWGASGHAKVLRELVEHLGYELVATFDNNGEVPAPFADVPLYYGTQGFERWKQENGSAKTAGLVAIGGASGRIRLDIQRFMEQNQVELIKVIHPTAFVAADAIIRKGSQILVNASVCPEVTVGEACILNTASSVDHESVLGNGVHIAPGAVLAGCVTVGDHTLIGPGAVVVPRVNIGSDVIVGAGSVVTKDVPNGKVAYGNPARIKGDNLNFRAVQ